MNTVLGTAVFTIIETVTLVAWLALVRSARQALGIVTLFVGLVIEHIVQFNVAGMRKLADLKELPIKGLVGFSAIETIIWAAWLVISMAAGHLVGIVFLAGTLIAKHAIADNVIVGGRFFDFRYASDGRVVTASILEAIGGQAWLIDVLAGQPVMGIVKLAGFSFVEHLILIGVARSRKAA